MNGTRWVRATHVTSILSCTCTTLVLCGLLSPWVLVPCIVACLVSVAGYLHTIHRAKRTR